jgi:hypothetical protein
MIDCKRIALRDVQIKAVTAPVFQIQDVSDLTMENDDFVPQPVLK